MTIRFIDYVLRCGRVFERAEHAVMVSLANNADDEGFARPSEGEIAWNSSLSVRHVRRVLKSLEWLSLIDIDEGGGRRTNRYFLNTTVLEQMAAEITRIKKKALQEGVDRYAEMDRVARHLRAQLEAYARSYETRSGDAESGQTADTASGQTANGVHEVHPVNVEWPHTTDTSSSPPGHCATNADAVSDSSGHDVHRTVNEPLKNPSTEPPKEPVQSANDIVQDNYGAYAPHHRERAQRIGELATKLGMTDLQLMRKAGGPDAADQFAKDVASGKMDLDQVRSQLARLDGE